MRRQLTHHPRGNCGAIQLQYTRTTHRMRSILIQPVLVADIVAVAVAGIRYSCSTDILVGSLVAAALGADNQVVAAVDSAAVVDSPGCTRRSAVAGIHRHIVAVGSSGTHLVVVVGCCIAGTEAAVDFAELLGLAAQCRMDGASVHACRPEAVPGAQFSGKAGSRTSRQARDSECSSHDTLGKRNTLGNNTLSSS